ncbi:MIZ/SP-RING zinc finger domain-containing protein [Ditylenchus destructor]|nr:MIZ/SP-RING zinc finger domain-containing protein [Ditylenchus destructor]
MPEASRQYNLRNSRKKPQGVLLKRWEAEYSKLISNKNRRISLETVKTAIRGAFKDGIVKQWRITLKCLLSGQRIKVPARYADCTHIQCFDLETFLRMKTQKNILVCPICQKEVKEPLNFLRIDKYIENVLSTLPHTMQVELLPDGSFTEVHEELVVVSNVITDEEPYVQDSDTSFDVKQEILEDAGEYIALNDDQTCYATNTQTNVKSELEDVNEVVFSLSPIRVNKRWDHKILAKLAKAYGYEKVTSYVQQLNRMKKRKLKNEESKRKQR